MVLNRSRNPVSPASRAGRCIVSVFAAVATGVFPNAATEGRATREQSCLQPVGGDVVDDRAAVAGGWDAGDGRVGADAGSVQ